MSIIIPTLDRLDLLQRCVASLGPNHKRDVLVVEAGTDGSGDWAEAEGLRVLRSPGATFARACNAGVEATKGARVTLLNNDVVLPPGWRPTSAWRLAVLGFRLLYPNGLVQHGGVGFDMAGNPHHLWHLAPGWHPEAKVSRYLPAVTFALVSIYRDVWRRLGGLDEGFANSYEDVDFCLRTRELGEQVYYCGERWAMHLTEQSPGRKDHVAESWAHFARKWLETGRLWKVLGCWPVVAQ